MSTLWKKINIVKHSVLASLNTYLYLQRNWGASELLLVVTDESEPMRQEHPRNRFEINWFVIDFCNKIMWYFLQVWFGKIEHDFKLCFKNHNMLCQYNSCSVIGHYYKNKKGISKFTLITMQNPGFTFIMAYEHSQLLSLIFHPLKIYKKDINYLLH